MRITPNFNSITSLAQSQRELDASAVNVSWGGIDPKVDLAAESIKQTESKIEVQANAKVVDTALQMQDHLLNIRV